MHRRVYTRLQAEAEFVHALTRQVGYTAGGFSIKRMAGIVAHFDDANAYQFELIKRLTSVGSAGEPLKEKYATDLLSFAAELGIIQKLPATNAPHLSRFILTDAGVAIRAARAIAPQLEQLILEHLILENDADAYLRVLWLLKVKPVAANDMLASEFLEMVFSARKVRLAWLQAAFPNKLLLMRLVKSGAAQVHWLKLTKLKSIEPERPKADFGRHHFTPRKSWANELGHFDNVSKSIMSNGLQLLAIAGWSDEASAQHWIGPPVECLEFLRLTPTKELVGRFAPTLDLLRPIADESDPDAKLVDQAADFLRAAFEHIKLLRARQALTSPLKYFLLDHERTAGKRYDLEKLLQTVARNYAHEFTFFSSRSGALAYYQLRNSENG